LQAFYFHLVSDKSYPQFVRLFEKVMHNSSTIFSLFHPQILRVMHMGGNALVLTNIKVRQIA